MHRITPADAGKTVEENSSSPAYWDHPRGCGENVISVLILPVKKGSPPRMRGKRTHTPPSKLNDRITPADAGKTR